MQNKPNFQNTQIDVSPYPTKDYEKKTLSGRGKNKPKTKPNKAKQTQNKPNFSKNPEHLLSRLASAAEIKCIINYYAKR